MPLWKPRSCNRFRTILKFFSSIRGAADTEIAFTAGGEEFQDGSEVMDEVLAGDQYWGADGPVLKPGVDSSNDQAIRCIRDAYAK